MKINSIQTKIAFWGGLCLLVSSIVTISYSVFSMRNSVIQAAQDQALVIAQNETASIRADIESALIVARTIADSFSIAANHAGQSILSRETANGILRELAEKNPSFVGVYTLWEPNAFDGLDAEYVNKPGHDQTGRLIPYWCRDSKGNVGVEALANYEVEGDGDYFQIPKRTLKEAILNPYIYPVQGTDVLLTSLVVPIIKNGTFLGIGGADIALDFLQTRADRLDIYNRFGVMALITNDGTLAGVTGQSHLVGKPMKELRPGFESNLSRIQKGEQSIAFVDGRLEVFVPLKIGKTDTPWSVMIQIPERVITAAATTIMWKQLGISLVFVIGALVLLGFIAKGIAAPIRQAVEFAERVADGDLRHQIDIQQNDEVGQLANALNGMCQNLNEMMANIQQAAEQVAASSEELSSSSQSLAQSATEQAGSLDITNASVAQLAESIEKNAEDAKKTDDVTTKASQDASEGGQAVLETVEAMKKIAQQISFIDDISDQTNLLALNAAIEAARAGEMGKGFAVVAVEVRKLAERSQQASKEIGELATQSVAKAENAGKLIQQVVPAIQNASVLTRGITVSCDEQSQGAEQIRSAIAQMDQITQQNSATSEESASASEQLSSQAYALQEMVSRFKLRAVDSSLGCSTGNTHAGISSPLQLK